MFYFLFFLGLAISLTSMPNPLIYLPLGIFVGFSPLFILNQRTAGWRRFFINLAFSELFALALLVPLDAANLVYVFQDTFFLVLLFSGVALIHALMITFSAILSDKYGWNLSPLIFGAAWTILQLIMPMISFVLTFPLETALSPLPIIIQSARFFGPYFIVFFIISTNALIANAVLKNNKRIWGVSIATLLLVHSVNLGYGYLSLNSVGHLEAPAKIVVIQPDISSMDYALKERSKLFEKLLDNKLVDISKDALEKKPDIIIWPELSKDYVLQNDQYLAYLHKTITSKGPELLVGTSYKDYSDKKKKFNIAFILKSDGGTTEPYRKTRIFPFSETLWLSRGNEYKTLPSLTLLKNIGCMICLESIYPNVSRGLTRAGANVLVCISTDAAFGNSMIPYIHSQSMVIRAVENNMYGIHAGNTGPSIICDNKGRITTRIPYGKTAFATADIYMQAKGAVH
jgi:apolipoprotein N-acyltransferase